jgi:hypothetical protein
MATACRIVLSQLIIQLNDNLKILRPSNINCAHGRCRVYRLLYPQDQEGQCMYAASEGQASVIQM